MHWNEINDKWLTWPKTKPTANATEKCPDHNCGQEKYFIADLSINSVRHLLVSLAFHRRFHESRTPRDNHLIAHTVSSERFRISLLLRYSNSCSFKVCISDANSQAFNHEMLKYWNSFELEKNLSKNWPNFFYSNGAYFVMWPLFIFRPFCGAIWIQIEFHGWMRFNELRNYENIEERPRHRARWKVVCCSYCDEAGMLIIFQSTQNYGD